MECWEYEYGYEYEYGLFKRFETNMLVPGFVHSHWIIWRDDKVMITSFDTRGLPISSKCSLREPSIQSKIPKASKRGQMIRKFLGKVSRKSENCCISEKRTIQLNNRDIPGGKPLPSNHGIPGKVVLFSGNYRKCCSIRHRKFRKFKPELLIFNFNYYFS